MTAYTVFRDLVLDEIRGANLAVVDDEIKSAVITLLADTKEYTMWHAAVDSVAEQMAYTLTDCPTGTQINEFQTVLYDEVPLDPIGPMTLDTDYPLWTTTFGTPFSYHESNMTLNTINLVYAPDTAVTGVLVVKSVLVPTYDSTEFPDVCWARKHEREAIVHRAKGILMAQMGKPYSNADMAKLHLVAYQAMCDSIKLKVQKGRVRQRVRITGHYF